MTRITAEWLPLSTFIDPRVHELLSDHVRQWSSRWFADRMSYTIGDLDLVKPAKRANDASKAWGAATNGFAASWTSKQVIDFAKQAVDARQRRHQCTGKDEELLITFAEAILSDLLGSFSQSANFPESAAFDPALLDKYGGLQFALTTGKKSDVHFKLAISSHHAALLRKSVMETAKERELPDARLADMFDKETVSVTAHVGRASLTAQALWDLAAGDIIILDQSLDDSFPMVSASNGEELCQLHLVKQESDNRLVVA